jgi:hypothetical protein
LGKTTDEVYLDLALEFRRTHPGTVRAEDVAAWIDAEKKLPTPQVSARRIHTRNLKQAFRRKRMKDGNEQTVREWLAIKIERMTANGQKVIEVIWDRLHEMSLDHALTAFSQRDEVITKQQRAATRDVKSCIDFNPNCKGHGEQFRFNFMYDEPVPVVSETISETETPKVIEKTPQSVIEPLSESSDSRRPKVTTAVRRTPKPTDAAPDDPQE